MDITEAIEFFKDAINSLRLVPKFENVDIEKKKYVSSISLEKSKKDNLKKCIVLLEKLKAELKYEISKLVSENNENNENIEEKYEIISKRHANVISEMERNKEKHNLICEIEEYEKMKKKKSQKIVFNKIETDELIKNIHFKNIDNDSIDEEDKKIIDDNVHLDYERIGIVEIDTLKRIFNSLNNS